MLDKFLKEEQTILFMGNKLKYVMISLKNGKLSNLQKNLFIPPWNLDSKAKIEHLIE
jgi:hypothetical protein